MPRDNNIPNEDIIKTCENEYALLKEELIHLKDCQIRFINFSLLTTGGILGFIGKNNVSVTDKGDFPASFMWLLPLLILLPSWWIFFEKAITISRIIGYLRVIEKLLLKSMRTDKFVGWENALKILRAQNITEGNNKIASVRWTTHKYWIIINATFFCLSLVCLIIGCYAVFVKKNDCTILLACCYVSVPLFLLTAVCNTRLLFDLIGGKHSYNSYENKWLNILEMEQI